MSWKKVRLGDILKQYRIEHRVDDKTTYKQVSILNDGNVVLRGEKIGKDIGRKRQFIIDTKKYPNTLIFTRQLLLQGSIGIASDDVHNCIVTENMPMFSIDTTKIDKEFLILFLKSKVFKARIGEIELSGSAQKSIHEKTFLNLEFVLPPFELQKTKVVELLKLKSNSDNISTELTHQLTLVKKLRQQLLQDAVQGKLVEQNKKDEPASELLEKIKAERLNRVGFQPDPKKNKAEFQPDPKRDIGLKPIKYSNHSSGLKPRAIKELPPIEPEEIPFQIPENWVWCRLGEICNYGSSPKAEPKSLTNDTWVLDLEDIEKETSNLLCKIRFNERNSLSTKSKFKRGEVLYSKLRPYLDKVIVADEDGVCTTEILPLKLYGNLNPFYIRLTLKRIDFLKYVNSVTKGMKMPRLGTSDGQMAIIPLPPLAEQNRIVQKLDELIQYCNELEGSIKQSESQNEKLLQQVLREALRKEPVEV
jgi:type I restriction enzyme, S subunit